MQKQNLLILIFSSFTIAVFSQAGPPQPQSNYGKTIEIASDKAQLWTASSGWKIGRQWEQPTETTDSVKVSAASAEADAVQLVFRPKDDLTNFSIKPSNLFTEKGDIFLSQNIEILKVKFVEIKRKTDGQSTLGPWPDPLPELEGLIPLEKEMNHPFWIRVKVPKNTQPGNYEGLLQCFAKGFEAKVPFQIQVFDFQLPDRMTCVTAFGLNTNNIWRYHNLKNSTDKKTVLNLYHANMSAHHISPYNPAPLDSIRVEWPKIKPPTPKNSQWDKHKIVFNEKHGGKRSLVIFDDRRDADVSIGYKKLIKIPDSGYTLKFWYRTALPDQRCMVTMQHYDKNQKWMSGRNRDVILKGDGTWQLFEKSFKTSPKKSEYIALRFRPARWSQRGENTGLAWFDDVSVIDNETKTEFVEGGDFEKILRTELITKKENLKVKLDFTLWDKAMSRAMDHYKFNSFRLDIPGLGGGTYHSLTKPNLIGFKESDPEYPFLLDSYLSQLDAHLKEKNWLEYSYVYWFDEPSPDQYAFVKNGFDKLKKSSPGIGRMLTEQVEPELIDGPNIWCSITNQYNHQRAEERRKFGEKFWWYVCTGPKAPYATLFIDHPGTEMRVWLWQTYQRNIEGILIWQSNFWTSDVAYPEKPQNPYEDPMGWVTGYDTPSGTKNPWGNGDGRLIYPPLEAANADSKKPVIKPPVDSIRWELLRDGIEDYEYLVILKRLLKEKDAKLNKTKKIEISELLTVPDSISKSMTEFTTNPTLIEQRRAEIAKAIEELEKL